MARMLSSHHVSKNIEFLTQDNVSSKSLARNVNVVNNRPLLVILTWLLSKRRHVMKFVNLYMEQGFDVAVVSLTPWQLMWPAKGSRVSQLLNSNGIFVRYFFFLNTSYQQTLFSASRSRFINFFEAK